MLLCVSVRPTRLPRLSTRLAPGKPEEQGAGWGFSPLFLQAPKQSAHRALQRHQPQRQQQVPGVQRAGQIKQGSVVILTHTDTHQQPLYKVLGSASSVEPNKVAVLLSSVLQWPFATRRLMADLAPPASITPPCQTGGSTMWCYTAAGCSAAQVASTSTWTADWRTLWMICPLRLGPFHQVQTKWRSEACRQMDRWVS